MAGMRTQDMPGCIWSHDVRMDGSHWIGRIGYLALISWFLTARGKTHTGVEKCADLNFWPDLMLAC